MQETPWSYVARFTTPYGTIYLKLTSELLALEAPILQTLRDQFQAAVPDVIAHNAELHCFLMKDAGTSLRSILKQTFEEALLPKVAGLCKKLSAYAIKQSIVQPDFNDNNTFVDDISQNITGQITISHPFFSLLNCLKQIKKYYPNKRS